ncbi:glycosyltransferase family 4 protein [Stutzerimonas kunmingensis]|uniref:glycosyltransferase family 4 protein n=1 Tax=Stutzerimonas kunmingensis TaxID=1211807 RepID=UPI00241EC5B6|nr:glycosyltransferase family 4 protein [Stutzerimonas kunmingensis]
MPKVLHFFKTYYPQTMGGIEQVIFQLAEGGVNHGYTGEVLYLSHQGSARGEPHASHIAHRSKLDFEVASTGFSVSALRDFAELAGDADIVHYHFPWPYMDLAHFVTRVRKPTVLTYHSDIVKQRTLLRLYSPLMHQFLKRVDRIVATSPNYVESSQTLQRYRDKVRVIPIGLAEATYPCPTDEKLAYWRKRVGERFFLFVGALRYYKGLAVLLEALRLSSFPVVVVGTGPEEAQLKALSQRYGLMDTQFLGGLPDDDKVALLSLCDGVVFPSHLRSEAFGISLLEGAMFSKPMISCEIGTGTTFINVAGETGLVVPPADPAALAQAMRSLWEQPDMAAQMGRRARERFEQLFTADSMVSSYATLYRELL